MDKLIFRTGLVTYAVLAILAIVFYLERTAFLDISYHLFYIIKDGTFAIQNNRFGAFVTQLFPLIGSKIGLPLSALMKLYSVGFVLYYFAIFFIISKVLRSYRYALVMLLFSTLMVTDTFYWIQSEFPQGLAFMILYFALLDSAHLRGLFHKWQVYPVLAIMIVTLVFFHPLLIFPFLFSSVFLYLEDKSFRKILKASSLFYVLLYIVKAIFFKTVYESNATSGVDNFIRLFPNYLSLTSNKQFLHEILSKYYLLILMLFGMLWYYFRQMQREYLYKAILILMFFTGYLLLVNVSFPNGTDSFYLENLYLPLSLFIIIPFVYDIRMSQKNYLILLILVLGIRIVQMGMTHEFYTDRIEWLESYINETKDYDQKKIIVSENHFPKNTLLMSWATPYEFWLLSTISGGETRSIMITDDVAGVEWTRGYNNKFVTKWGAFDYNELPAKYFNFKDTTLYQFIY